MTSIWLTFVFAHQVPLRIHGTQHDNDSNVVKTWTLDGWTMQDHDMWPQCRVKISFYCRCFTNKRGCKENLPTIPCWVSNQHNSLKKRKSVVKTCSIFKNFVMKSFGSKLKFRRFQCDYCIRPGGVCMIRFKACQCNS